MSDGLIDRNGKPLGTDFSNVYAAGTLTWQAGRRTPMTPPLQHAAEKRRVRRPRGAVLRLALSAVLLRHRRRWSPVPYALGLAAVADGEPAAYLATVRAILPRPETLLVAAAFPAVFVNVGHGQNGFLTAALLGGALQLLDRRPSLAGVLIGFLAYKPQFGLLIPLALLAGKRWITIAAAAATVAALIALSVVMLGTDVWHAFPTPPLHPDRRARTGRHRLGEDPVDLLGGADVGRQRPRRLCGANRADADARRLRSPGCGAAPPRSSSRRRRSPPPACWRRLTCSTTISSCCGAPSRSSRATVLRAAFALRSQPAGGCLDRAAAVARHRRRDRHATRAYGAAHTVRSHLASRGARSNSFRCACVDDSRKRDPIVRRVAKDFPARAVR